MRASILSLLLAASACGGVSRAPQNTVVTPVATAPAPEENDPFANEVFPPGPPRPPPVRVSAIERLGVTPPESPWSEMSTDERTLYMIGKVLPIMQETFAMKDSRRFCDFKCETCHGADMRERHFEMPSPSAFPVPPPDSRAFARLERRQPDMVRFMKNTVTPTMGRLLGNDSYTCAHCHPTAAP